MATNINNILEYAKSINKIQNTNYFEILEHIPTLESFLRSQKSFVTAIDFWSKVLASLLIHMPSDRERGVIMRNLWDEHGAGNPSKSHVETFRSFMRVLGYRGSLKIEYLNTDPHIFNFIKGLNSLYKHNLEPENYGNKQKRANLIFAVSALGMIEFTYIEVSKNIHKYASKFVQHETIPHYANHEIIDLGHSTELFSLVADNWTDEFNCEVKAGIQEGYNLLVNLYTGMAEFLRLD